MDSVVQPLLLPSGETRLGLCTIEVDGRKEWHVEDAKFQISTFKQLAPTKLRLELGSNYSSNMRKVTSTHNDTNTDSECSFMRTRIHTIQLLILEMTRGYRIGGVQSFTLIMSGECGFGIDLGNLI